MAFGTALSGIQAATKDLDVIGNNIANVNTNGFKSSRAEFVDVYSSGSYGSSATQIGSGTRLSRVQQSFAQGSLSFSSNSLDMGISGSGFFVINNNGSNLYTRAGSFGLDNDGFIVNAKHQQLMGYQADAEGVVGTTTGPLQVQLGNISPKSTTTMSTGVNLYSGAKPPAINWTGGATPPTNTYTNPMSSTVYDSLGNSHIVSMYYIKADSAALAGAPNAASPPGTENQWYVAFQIDNQNVPANVGTENTDNLYRVNFNQDGSFAGAADQSNTPLANNQIPLNLALSNGAGPLNFTVDMSNSTQFGSPFGIQSNTQDGYTTGRIDGLDIDADGVLFARYTNGKTRAMGQVQLANFNNPDGLTSTGDTNWAETASSGQPLVGMPGTSSLGSVQAGALEESNVDLTGELVKMISAQRNFQANAKVITTESNLVDIINNIVR